MQKLRNSKIKSRPPKKTACLQASVPAGVYLIVGIIIPRFHIPHRPLAVPDPGGGRIHNNPVQAQEGQDLE